MSKFSVKKPFTVFVAVIAVLVGAFLWVRYERYAQNVRRNRVRNTDISSFDIHDRVNYAVTGTSLKVDPVEKKIALNLQIDESICTMYEYFDIFLNRMLMCRGAAEMLGCQFRLTVNGGKVL